LKNKLFFNGKDKYMFKKSILYLLLFLFSSSYPVFAEENNQCKPPYKPSDIFTVIFNYSEGMNYISFAKKACSNIFAQELTKTFQESFWVSKGCLEVTLQDIKKAKSIRNDKISLS
jgi:hypothetical protein